MKLQIEVIEALQGIDDSYLNDASRSYVRKYIGASSVGNPCTALLALSLRGYPETPPDPHVLRIFKLGHAIEDMVVEDLKRHFGIMVMDKDPRTGRQYSFKLFGGHVSGHADGIVELSDGQCVILEIKSMNQARWDSFVQLGMKASNPTYYSQVQMLMGMSGMTRALFVGYCKNNSKYHMEIVDFDEFEYSALLANAEIALNNEAWRVADDPTSAYCTGCFKREACWGLKDVDRGCRTCSHAEAREDGGWFCNEHGKDAPMEPCDRWNKYLPKVKK